MKFMILASLFAFASSAWAEDAPSTPDPRDDVFGAAPAEPPADASQPTTDAAPAAATSRDDALLSTPSSAPTDSTSLLDEADKYLDIGGQLFLRGNGTFREEQGLSDVEPTSPNLLDIYADVRPNDRLRGFTQLRLTFDPTVESDDVDTFGNPRVGQNILLDQAFIKFDAGRVAYLTAGRQRIRWGTGRFWNPTDFVNQNIRNSVDFFDNRIGVDLVKLHFPFEALGWNLYLIGAFDGIDTLDQTGLAARAEFLIAETELAVSTLVRKDAPVRVGADLSTSLWIFDFRAEGTLQRGLDRKRFEGDLDFEKLEFPKEVNVDNDWFFQGVVGADFQIKYTDQDNLILGGEYFYNQTGYDSATIYPFLALNGGFVPLYLGEHYMGVFASAPSPFAWNDATFTLSTLGNLSDKSFLTRLDFQLQILTYLTLNLFAALHYGNTGEFHLGIDVPPVPAIPALQNGFEIKREIVDGGVALRVEF